jgi:hypothetical protein
MRTLRRRTAIALPVLAAVASLTGCARGVPNATVGPGGPADGGGVAVPQPGSSGNPADALAAWSSFPVDRRPRPIVLVGPSMVGYAGYTTGAAKVAAMSGSYRLAVTLPPDPQPTPVDLPGGRATLPVIGAAAAIERMKADTGGKPDPSVAPLAIVGIEFGTAPIDTDRGTLTLPVWRVHTADELGPTTVLAVADSALAVRAGSAGPAATPGQPASGSAKASADGRRLTLTVQEAVPHCPGQPIYQTTAGVRESATAVVVVFTRTQVSAVPADPGGACALYLKLQPVTYHVDLAAPLGNRVLVDADGNPQPVTTG